MNSLNFYQLQINDTSTEYKMSINYFILLLIVCKISSMLIILGCFMGFAIGVFCLGAILVFFQKRDDLLMQDLLDRLTANGSIPDYMSLLHYRKNELSKPMPKLDWWKNFSFKPIKKNLNIPTPAEIEMNQAKKAAAETAKEKEAPTAYDEFEQQQNDRKRRMTFDGVMP